jgi:DNA-binding response OmpR family regulator
VPHDHVAARKSVAVKTILVVADDPDTAAFLSRAITQETAYHPLVVADGSEAACVMQQIIPNLLIIGMSKPLELTDLLQTIEQMLAAKAEVPLKPGESAGDGE